MKHYRPCSAITTKGRRCQMNCEPNELLCKYHDERHPARIAVHARNLAGTKAYWQRWRVAKALAASASVDATAAPRVDATATVAASV